MTADECAAKSTAMAEKELQQQIRALLDRLGIWYHWSRMDRKTTCRVGTPDFLFVVCQCVSGELIRRPLAFECKANGNKLTPEQRDAERSMMGDGWYYFVIRDYVDALNILRDLGIKGI